MGLQVAKISTFTYRENGGDFGRKRKGKEEEKRRKKGGIPKHPPDSFFVIPQKQLIDLKLIKGLLLPVRALHLITQFHVYYFVGIQNF